MNPESKMGKGMHPVQQMGSKHTYLKRYLYNNLYNIVDADAIEATAGDETPAKTTTKKATAPKVNMISKEQQSTMLAGLTAINNDADRLKIVVKEILTKHGLKKFNEIPLSKYENIKNMSVLGTSSTWDNDDLRSWCGYLRYNFGSFSFQSYNKNTGYSVRCIKDSISQPVTSADFIGTPTYGTVPLQVQFTDLSTGNPACACFGNSGRSSSSRTGVGSSRSKVGCHEP